MDAAAPPPAFRQIGKGFCGSVWAADHEDAECALKREDGGEGRSILNDAQMHQRIEESLLAVQGRHSATGRFTRLNIPEYRDLIRSEDAAWWTTRLARFPGGYEPCNTLVSERIRPLPRDAREKLVDLFCPARLRETIKRSKKDEECLIRPYLGRRTHNSRPSMFFTLRNKPLHLNQMEDVGLPVEDYARVMADALATMHWHAKVDANDVEFVLAPAGAHEGKTETFESPTLGLHAIWILDFDCVKEISLDEMGVEKAAAAFWKNDPFYPRPGGEDEGLWDIFKQRFLDSSGAILGESNLPEMLVKRLEDIGQERKEKIDGLRENLRAEAHFDK